MIEKIFFYVLWTNWKIKKYDQSNSGNLRKWKQKGCHDVRTLFDTILLFENVLGGLKKEL